MNRFPKERLEREGPLQPGLLVQQPLEVPQLMGQTDLPALGWRLELGTQTITDPALRLLLPHHFLNHFRPATRPHEEVHSRPYSERPIATRSGPPHEHWSRHCR